MKTFILACILVQLYLATCVKVSKFVQNGPCFVKDINRSKGVKYTHKITDQSITDKI